MSEKEYREPTLTSETSPLSPTGSNPQENIMHKEWAHLLRFLKNWTLPVAMTAGVAGYFLLSRIPFLAPAKHVTLHFSTAITPVLIFCMLLLTFCKVEVRELRPRRWHVWILLIQLFGSIALALAALACSDTYKEVLEGALMCLICPTATAAAVITSKLGGSASTVASYTLLSNLLAAAFVPLVIPLIEPHADVSFWAAAVLILSKLFFTLICPFLAAQMLRMWWPALHARLLGRHELAFYLWSFSLAIVSAQTTRSIVNSTKDLHVELLIALAALLICGLQFFLGKTIGSLDHDRISAGQALGQKNTILAIWMAYTFLNPISSIAPGSYVLWQNIINSWQLWKKRKRDAVAASAG